MKIQKRVLCPDRVRKIEVGFSFIPHRFLRAGFFSSLTPYELLVYFLLILTGDQVGLSYYSQDKLCNLLGLELGDFLDARNGLIEKELIAFDGYLFQVLALPEKPVGKSPKLLTSQADYEQSDPLTVRKIIKESLFENDNRDEKIT